MKIERKMMDNFKLFNNEKTVKVVDKITITKNFLINFPSAFCKINKVEDKKTVLLYFDEDSLKIGLDFIDEADPRGFKITKSAGGRSGGYITAKGFFTLNGLAGKIRTGRYDYEVSVKDSENQDCKNKFFMIKLERI